MELRKASENKEVFANLYNLYVYDLTEGTPIIGRSISDQGTYEPPHGIDAALATADSYIIYEDNKPIGFVSYIEGKEADYCIQEIFVIKAYRRQGIATEIIDRYLKDKSGSFMVHILKGSVYAAQFFTKYFKEHDLMYRKEERDVIADNYFVDAL